LIQRQVADLSWMMTKGSERSPAADQE